MTSRRQPCLLCEGRDLRLLHSFNSHLITQCRRCSLVFVNPPPDRERLQAYMEECMRGEGPEETREMFSDLRGGYKENPVILSYENILKRLESHSKGRKLLDVGCGTGVFVDMAIECGFEAKGMDSSQSVADIARREIGIEAVHADFDTHFFGEEKFDCITMLDFLEHVPDPLGTARKASKTLKPGGLLLIVSPNHRSLLYMLADRLKAGSRIEKLYHFSHVALFDPYSMRFLLDRAGFALMEMWQESPWIGRFTLPRHIKLGLEAVNILSRSLGLESRIGVLARKGSPV